MQILLLHLKLSDESQISTYMYMYTSDLLIICNTSRAVTVSEILSTRALGRMLGGIWALWTFSFYSGIITTMNLSLSNVNKPRGIFIHVGSLVNRDTGVDCIWGGCFSYVTIKKRVLQACTC